MLSITLLIISILGIAWLAIGLVISVRNQALSVNFSKIVLCAIVFVLAFLASIAANSIGW
ncbi:MAG: hypothetical protein Q7S66_05625 [bacterium]|nr:hypothetical protein [bacterium]